MSQLRTNVYQYFQTDDIPTEEQFQYTWNSIWFKDEKFSISDITGLEKALQNKLGINHASDENAHHNILAKLDASNLNDEQKEVWKEALGVGSIPDNVALVDEGESQQVYNKDQIRAMAMMIADYTINGKIRADKIEALGLTDLIEASENTLAAFVANSGNYEFQKNDFIALPDMNGNFSLFMFKGGNKSVVVNYLPTGLTKITIAMVEGLQSALDGKMGKPTQNGSFFAKNTNGLTSWQNINAGASYLLFWDGDNFKNSSIFREASGNKFGIGNSAPTEQLHLTGRIRTNAMVLDDNSENLPNQITKNGNRFYGSNSSAIKRGLMYNDAADLTATMANSSDSEKEAWRLAQRKSNETYSIGQPKIFSLGRYFFAQDINYATHLIVFGANLFVNNTDGSALITIQRKFDENGNATSDSIIDLTQYVTVISLLPNMMSIVYDYFNLPKGKYLLKVMHNGLTNIDNVFFNIVNSLLPVPMSDLTLNNNTSGSLNQLNIIGKTINLTSPAYSGDYSFDTLGVLQNLENDGYIINFSVNFNEPSNNMSGKNPYESFYFGFVDDLQPFIPSSTLIAGFEIRYGAGNSAYRIINQQNQSEWVYPQNQFNYAIKLSISINKGIIQVLDALSGTYTSFFYSDLSTVRFFGKLLNSTDRQTNYVVTVDSISKIN